MSKVLLVDTNISSSPIYDFLVKEKHDVTVIGANPHDFLAKTATQYIEADYSDRQTLTSVVRRLGYDFVVPGCNDRSYLACAELNIDGFFPGIDPLATAEIINNKQLFREFALSNGLPVPKVYAPEACPVNQPVIVKPVDAFSGRGVTIIYSPDNNTLAEARVYAESMSRSGACIIEDYVEGQLYSHSCFLQDKLIGLEFIVEEHGTANHFVVDTSRVVNNFPEHILTSLRENIEKMAHILEMGDGLIHTQFILNEDKFWLIEITRRCPGDLYSRLIELSTGIPYAELYTRPFVGMGYPIFQQKSTVDFIMRHTMSFSKPGVIGGIGFKCPVMLERMYPMCVAGDTLRESPFGRASLLFIRASSSTDLDDIFARTLKRDLYFIEH